MTAWKFHYVLGWLLFYFIFHLWCLCSFNNQRTWKFFCPFCLHPWQILSHGTGFPLMFWGLILLCSSSFIYLFIYLDPLHVLDLVMLRYTIYWILIDLVYLINFPIEVGFWERILEMVLSCSFFEWNSSELDTYMYHQNCNPGHLK